ncbi:MAG TPA: S1C family serine protease, partial [Thermoanaerobaculia bacterium]
MREIFTRSAKAVVKIRGVDQHGKLSGTGFFVDPAGTLYTAYSVGSDAGDFTVELDGKEIPARQVLADRRSGLAILKVDVPTPSLPLGRSHDVEVATPVLTVGFPLDLPQTPSFGMIAGFDRKFLGRYFSTT